jgi:hypothetical protein
MNDDRDLSFLADLAEGAPGTGLEGLTPQEVDELEIARRVRALMAELRTSDVAIPEGFEARLMERLSGDTTLLQMVDLWLAGVGRILVELAGILLNDQPLTPPSPAPSPAR